MDTPLRADQVRRAIAAATQRLAELDVETGQIRARIDALQTELTADVVAAAPVFVQPTRDPSTSPAATSASGAVLIRGEPMGRGWSRTGMFLAIAGAAVSGSIQAVLIFGSYYAAAPGPRAEFAAVLRIALLAVGAVAALARRPWIVIFVFLVHTWPTGLYMMLLPGLGAYAGLATLAMPIGAALIYIGRRKSWPMARQ